MSSKKSSTPYKPGQSSKKSSLSSPMPSRSALSSGTTPSSTKRKQTLAEQIAALTNPTPKDFDPEDVAESGMNASTTRVEDEDYEEDEAPKLFSERSSIRKNFDVDDVSKEYEGKVISRKSLQAFSDDEEDEAEEDEEMEDGEAEEEDEYAGEDAGDDELIDDDEEEDGEDADEDQEDQDDDDEDDDHEYGASSMLVDGLTDQQLKVQQQLAALEEEDEQTTSVFQPRGSAATSATATSSTTASSQYTKSVHMKNQLVWYKHLLNLRIRLQGVLSNANRLPPPVEEAADEEEAINLREQFEAESEEVKPAFDDAIQNARKLLEELFELQSGLMTQNEKIFAANQGEDDSATSSIPTYQGVGKKRKHSGDDDEDDDAETQPAADDIDSDEILDSYWSYLSATVTPFFRPVQDALITKWNTKTQLSAGQLHALAGGSSLGRGGAVDSKTNGLKVINQSILAQIDSQMMDETRLIKRTQIHRMNAEQKLLGRVKKEREAQAQKKHRTADQHDDELNDPASGLLGRVQTEDDYDAFIYDDNDYYQQLLQEIISANNAAAADTGDSDLISSAQSARKKTRKSGAVVDRRASKGRKLRYTIHPKLANFMAPKPAPITMEYEANKSAESGGMTLGSGFAMDELFMNLFGGLGKQ